VVRNFLKHGIWHFFELFSAQGERIYAAITPHLNYAIMAYLFQHIFQVSLNFTPNPF
jgi:hypothetical protein